MVNAQVGLIFEIVVKIGERDRSGLPTKFPLNRKSK